MSPVKNIIIAFSLLAGAIPGFAKTQLSRQQHFDFIKALTNCNISFTAPEGFKEIKIPGQNTALDYALELPNQDFTVVYSIDQIKQNPENTDKARTEGKKGGETPDSAYLTLAQARANELSGTGNHFSKDLPTNMLWHFNANEGKSYFLNLIDAENTRHYKYGLLLVLQKNRIGSVMILCMGNETGPGFFKNVRKATRGLRFKT